MFFWLIIPLFLPSVKAQKPFSLSNDRFLTQTTKEHELQNIFQLTEHESVRDAHFRYRTGKARYGGLFSAYQRKIDGARAAQGVRALALGLAVFSAPLGNSPFVFFVERTETLARPRGGVPLPAVEEDTATPKRARQHLR